MAQISLSLIEVDQAMRAADEKAVGNGHNILWQVTFDGAMVGACASCGGKVEIPKTKEEFGQNYFGIPLYAKCGNHALGSQSVALPWLQPA
ncbi:MAG: hypothetical protein WCT19_00100 [Candidatus Paceibacterota bacterium]|jgi:hypothetical protein